MARRLPRQPGHGDAGEHQAPAREPEFEFRYHNCVDYIDVSEPVDAVFHLASPASPVDYMRLPLHTLKVGSYGTHNALGLAKFKRARFLLASTSEVYGDPEVHPQREEYWGNVNPVGPRGVYDEAKRYSEAMTMAYHRQQGVDTHIVRIFNTYGPRMRQHDGRAIPTFIRQALEGKPMTVFGDGSQTRSFCYVDDLVDGIVRLALSDFHDPVNIGNPNEMTLLELAETIQRMTGTTSEIVFEGLPIDDPKVRRPDIGRAREVLGWEPKVTPGGGPRANAPEPRGQAGRRRALTRRIAALGGGGFSGGGRAIDDHLLALTGKPRPRVCFVPTASGDAATYVDRFVEAFPAERVDASVLPLFARPDADPAELLLAQDVIYVGGGNTANMLAIWRLHGVDAAMREAYERGILLCGTSAGANCWFEACSTDSFGPGLKALRDGLGLVPGGFCPHFDGEELRRPTLRRMVNEGEMPATIACDDGVAVIYEDGVLSDIVTERAGAAAYRLEPGLETKLPARLL